jgi:hypothetical protein
VGIGGRRALTYGQNQKKHMKSLTTEAAATIRSGSLPNELSGELAARKRGVAQPGSALGSGPRSRRFKSSRPDCAASGAAAFRSRGAPVSLRMSRSARCSTMRSSCASVAFLAHVWSCSHGAPDASKARAPSGAQLPPSDSGDAGDDGFTVADVELPKDADERRVTTAAVDGPHYLSLESGRPIYYAFPGKPRGGPEPWRLVANLHGTCGGPLYACGSWVHAGVGIGALVCPTGNAHCGSSPLGPPTWEAPSWGELVRDMDVDLERSIAIVLAHRPRSIRREGAILSGYSRGGYAVPFIAGMHPGRWPMLLIIEADATLDPASLRRARVSAVALVAGELGDQIAGMRKTAGALAAASFPGRLFVMPRTGHPYSENIEDVMREALAFLLSSEDEADAR